MPIIVMPSVIAYMRFAYMWPPEPEEMNPSKWYHVKFAAICSSTVVAVVGSILHLVLISIPNKSLYYIAEDLIVITAQIGVYYYIIAYISMQKLAAQLYLRLSTFERFGKPPEFDEHSRKLNLVAFAYKISLHMVVLAYLLEPLLTRRLCEKENEMRKFKDICALVTPSWMPFNIADFPYKQMFFLWQLYSVTWVYHSAAAVTILIVLTMEHLLVRVWHLKDLIREVIETRDVGFRKKRFNLFVEYHQDVFDLANTLDTVYRKCLFAHVLFSGVLIGIMGFSTMTVGVSYKTLTLFAVWVWALIFASFSAQRLYDYSLAVGDEVYNSPWYNTDYKFQKDLIIVLRRAQKPITIHGGPFSQISHVFILTILKSAYSYLTLLTATAK